MKRRRTEPDELEGQLDLFHVGRHVHHEYREYDGFQYEYVTWRDEENDDEGQNRPPGTG